ncbi:MAG: hypothetical protein AAFN70_08615, partial [Planctomycetota bacterium]
AACQIKPSGKPDIGIVIAAAPNRNPFGKQSGDIKRDSLNDRLQKKSQPATADWEERAACIRTTALANKSYPKAP